jgi:hypothetical protein
MLSGAFNPTTFWSEVFRHVVVVCLQVDYTTETELIVKCCDTFVYNHVERRPHTRSLGA